MGMDIRLTEAASKLVDATCSGNEEATKLARENYFTEFERVAASGREGVLEYEMPDIGSYLDDDPEDVVRVLDDFTRMVEIINRVNYPGADSWNEFYREFYEEYGEVKAEYIRGKDDLTADDIEGANVFWDAAKARVERIASAHGLAIELRDHDDEFLYALYDSGEYVPTDEEVLEAIEEVQK